MPFFEDIEGLLGNVRLVIAGFRAALTGQAKIDAVRGRFAGAGLRRSARAGAVEAWSRE